MDSGGFSDFIFSGLHPHFMASITILLAGVYVFKYVCVNDACFGNKRPIYLLKAFLWAVFAVSWSLFPYLDLATARASLRAMVAIIVLVEIAYNVLYINEAIRGTWRWILRK